MSLIAGFAAPLRSLGAGRGSGTVSANACEPATLNAARIAIASVFRGFRREPLSFLWSRILNVMLSRSFVSLPRASGVLWRFRGSGTIDFTIVIGR